MKRAKYSLLLIFLLSCDFTPKVHKKILNAQNKIKEQKIDSAIEIYEETLNYHLSKETKVKILFQLGELYSLYKGELNKSLYYYSEVLKITNDVNWLVKSEEKIGNLNFSYLKNHKNAYVSYKKLYNFRPKLKNIEFYHYRYALTLSRLKVKKAKEELEKITKDKDHSYFKDAFFSLGLYYFELSDWDKTIEILSNYLKLNISKDKEVKAKFIIANCYETKEELNRAYNFYYSIIRDHPNPKIIEEKLKSIYNRRVARKR